MKRDANDVLREEGPDAVRARHDQAEKFNGASERQKHWIKECIKGETGKPLAILANTLLCLRNVWPDHFAYDEMLCAPMLMLPLKNTNGVFSPRR